MSLTTVTRKLEDFRRDVSRTRRASGSLTTIALCCPPLAAVFGTGTAPNGYPSWVLPAVAGVLLVIGNIAAIGEAQLRRSLTDLAGVLALCDRMYGTGNDQVVTRRLADRKLGRVNLQAPSGHLAAIAARRREAWAAVAVGAMGMTTCGVPAGVFFASGQLWAAAACVPLVVWRGWQVTHNVRELRVYAVLADDIHRKTGAR